MKPQKPKDIKQAIFLCIAFLILFSSYSVNIWKVSDENMFLFFERQPEGLVVGRIAKAAHDGIFSYGGLTGLNYTEYLKTDSLGISTMSEEYSRNLSIQHDLYLTNSPLPNKFVAYKSQTGGQAILYSAIQKISPFDNLGNLRLFKGLNAALAALCFVLFIGWVYRNYGGISSIITLFLLLISPWINNFAHNLWWALWSFYIPFITMLLLFEKKHNFKDKMSNNKILIYLFLAVFAKCFFTGFEFITSTLIAAMCPIVYYYILEQKNFRSFIGFAFKGGTTMVMAVLAEMFVLIMQIRSLEGSFSDGINHILLSYTKRATYGIIKQSETYGEILQKYFQGNVFDLGFLPQTEFKFYFGVFFLIICLFGVAIYFISKKLNQVYKIKNLALISATLFSVLSPLSWFIIFKQHASEHPHMDYIVWYIPTLLFGFIVIGQGISLIIARARGSHNKPDVLS